MATRFNILAALGFPTGYDAAVDLHDSTGVKQRLVADTDTGSLLLESGARTHDLSKAFKTVADPGDAGAIPVTGYERGQCPIVTGGAETRTLADPTYAGQELLVYMHTDGGNAVITSASAVNATGNNTITFADASDVLDVVAVETAAGLVWRVRSSDGAALTTV